VAQDTGTDQIFAWEDDPGEPPVTRKPVLHGAVDLAEGGLPVEIKGAAPTVGAAEQGTEEFRYWVAADALDRARRLWRELLPQGQDWFEEIGPRLQVDLDAEETLNAFYSRDGLEFAHGRAGEHTIFSCESPDIVSHELGHAVLDAIRPELFHAGATEPSAFHEFFGDASALLTALDLESLRQHVLGETGPRIDVTSRVSRLAEQVGWAIRQRRPDRVEANALRDAATSWFYRRPEDVAPSGPVTVLTTESHNFSRIFTGAFLKILAGMALAQPSADSDGLAQAVRDAGRLLVDAVTRAPIVPSYYSQVAAHMLEADLREFEGRYREALQFGFVRHGILSLEGGARLASPESLSFAADGTDGVERESLGAVALPADRYGLPGALLIDTCSHTRRFSVASAAPDVGAVLTPTSDRAAASFVEDLFRQGRIDTGVVASGGVAAPLAYKTHALEPREGNRVKIVRRRFDCGVGSALDR
jgi:hypothetical protein